MLKTEQLLDFESVICARALEQLVLISTYVSLLRLQRGRDADSRARIG